ncbi:hypothetical protein shim_13960 [Shimia sp. SK013]|uniref:YbjN domain-containing protein n=1 Tax=Shimia sp. SK013 TaxID=1389006 RepID=UPI0006B45F97|nr:YbjN domain-containing protein [Shimia sp. SK013]KPA23102.1 hypothetical protein shim_13960 [Shimia sp. SK013]
MTFQKLTPFVLGCVLSLGLVVSSADVANAHMVRASSPGTVVDALNEEGFDAQMDTSSSGRTRIRSSYGEVNFTIWFYGCDGDKENCTSLNFSAGFDLSDGSSYSEMNDWNRRKLVGRGYLDSEEDPFLDLYVAIDQGVSHEHFSDVLYDWTSALDEFSDFIDY